MNTGFTGGPDEQDPYSKNFKRVSPLHASRMQSKKLVQESRESYKKDETDLKDLRLSIENIKVDTI